MSDFLSLLCETSASLRCPFSALHSKRANANSAKMKWHA